MSAICSLLFCFFSKFVLLSTQRRANNVGYPFDESMNESSVGEIELCKPQYTLYTSIDDDTNFDHSY
jgi:hypothetical protein